MDDSARWRTEGDRVVLDGSIGPMAAVLIQDGARLLQVPQDMAPSTSLYFDVRAWLLRSNGQTAVRNITVEVHPSGAIYLRDDAIGIDHEALTLNGLSWHLP